MTPVARMTVCAATSDPSSKITTRDGPRALEPDDLPRGEQLGTEAQGLAARPLGELRAGDPVGEAEVVLDAGALPGLATGRLALDEDGAQTLACAVHGGTQACRSGADHDKVVEIGGRFGGQAHGRGHLGVGRLRERLPRLR